MVDLVLAMTVNPGYSGQAFISASLRKIELLRGMLDHRQVGVHLQVDGGIAAESAPRAAAAGADVFVAASAIFKHAGGPRAGVEALRLALLQTPA